MAARGVKKNDFRSWKCKIKLPLKRNNGNSVAEGHGRSLVKQILVTTYSIVEKNSTKNSKISKKFK